MKGDVCRKKSTFTARLISFVLIAALMLAGTPVIAADNATATTTAPALEAATPVVTQTYEDVLEYVIYLIDGSMDPFNFVPPLTVNQQDAIATAFTDILFEGKEAELS